MPVKKDSSGRRSVQAEVELPGSPEDVWQAIATGPGISSWFVPTELDGREGGAAVSHFGPGNSMDSVAKITLWEPPHRFVAETHEGPGTVATEWTVEARSGGACVVRVVHSWFASTDDWDGQYEGHSYGWISFFQILRLYLTHFRGQSCSPVQLMAMSTDPKEKAWDLLIQPLGLANASIGTRVTTPVDAPELKWLLDSDPSIRWQVMRDLAHEPDEVVAAERSRVAAEGWGARLSGLSPNDLGDHTAGLMGVKNALLGRFRTRSDAWTVDPPARQGPRTSISPHPGPALALGGSVHQPGETIGLRPPAPS